MPRKESLGDRFRYWLFKPLIERFNKLELSTMTASADLTANVAALTVSVNTVANYVATLQGDDPAVVAANAELVAIKGQLDALVPAAPAA